MGFGDYPAGYNREIHGPFDPTRYYGKPDTAFVDVKLVELPAWLSRRSLNPGNWLGACGRFYWRWRRRWYEPKSAGAAWLYQMIFVTSTMFYIINYRKHWNEMRCKYH